MPFHVIPRDKLSRGLGPVSVQLRTAFLIRALQDHALVGVWLAALGPLPSGLPRVVRVRQPIENPAGSGLQPERDNAVDLLATFAIDKGRRIGLSIGNVVVSDLDPLRQLHVVSRGPRHAIMGEGLEAFPLPGPRRVEEFYVPRRRLQSKVLDPWITAQTNLAPKNRTATTRLKVVASVSRNISVCGALPIRES